MSRLILPAVLFIAGSAAVLTLSAQEEPRPAVKIGVVELSRCFNADNYPAIKEVDKELQALAQRLTKEAQEKQNDPKALEEGKQEYIRFYNRKKLEVYKDIVRIIRQVGDEGGYTLIEKVDSSDIKLGDGKPLNTSIRERAILYHDDSLDITDEVLTRLNADYEKRKKKSKRRRDF